MDRSEHGPECRERLIALGAPANGSGGRGRKAVDNVNSFSGNEATYALRRLKRDNPDLAEQVVAGVLSAHAAAVQAG